MKILFTFENIMPSNEADAEVFMTTARHLAPFTAASWLHLPVPTARGRGVSSEAAGLSVIRALAPAGPAMLRHLCCGLTMIARREFRQADMVYTRNLWVAWLAVRFGQQVVFDHYRPWPDQIPPLQPLLRRLICSRRFLVNICHSDYTRRKYLEVGVDESKLCCIHNGFDPRRLQPSLSIEIAKRTIGVRVDRTTIVYTGRINHKKGLELVVEAARMLPDFLFILVGSTGEGPIEALAKSVPNVRLVGWRSPGALGTYILAADVLLIPPSIKPLAEFGSTVLPLKLFLYMASGRPILAGSTPDVRELLEHDRNAFLCRPDCLASLVAGLRTLAGDEQLGARLATEAVADSRALTWDARARRIADVIDERVRSSPAAACRRRSGLELRAWLRQSWRWLVHLIRKGSWVLPPNLVAPARRR